MPGGGGACLHTVLTHPTDPDDLLVAMSAAGVYHTRDGGATWQRANRGIQVAHVPEEQRFPEFGQCVHKVAFHPDRPERLFAQNHFGVYRSEDRGDSWSPIESGTPEQLRVRDGCPSSPARHALLLSAPGGRRAFSPRREAARLLDRGRGIQLGARANGLPTDPYYAAVLRDAMVADSEDPAGIYFGTRLGEVLREPGRRRTAVAHRRPPARHPVRASCPDRVTSRLPLPAALRRYAGEQAEVEHPSGTLGEALDDLAERLPQLERRLRDEQGQLRPQVLMFVDGVSVEKRRTDGHAGE